MSYAIAQNVITNVIIYCWYLWNCIRLKQAASGGYGFTSEGETAFAVRNWLRLARSMLVVVDLSLVTYL